MGASNPSTLVTAVARLVAETRSLRDVVSRLTALLRDALPFDQLHLLRLDRADAFVLYSARLSGEVEITSQRIGAPGALPEPVHAGARSRLVSTIRQDSVVHGVLWLTAECADAFTPADQEFVDSVADLLVLALQNAALLERSTLRRERIDSLRGLLHTMAGSLDIRAVFSEISDVVRGGLPHDILAVTSWGVDGASFRLYAIAGAQIDDPSLWEPTALTGSDRDQLNTGPYVVHDAKAEIPADSVRGRIFAQLGVQSALRVPMPLGKDVFGSVFFLSRTTDNFSEDDIDFARRVADHLALALSHERLAEAARRAAESRARRIAPRSVDTNP
jgi:GAF domain-containing protein